MDNHGEEEAFVRIQGRKRGKGHTLLVLRVFDEGRGGGREVVVRPEMQLRPVELAEIPSCRCTTNGSFCTRSREKCSAMLSP